MYLLFFLWGGRCRPTATTNIFFDDSLPLQYVACIFSLSLLLFKGGKGRPNLNCATRYSDYANSTLSHPLGWGGRRWLCGSTPLPPTSDPNKTSTEGVHSSNYGLTEEQI